MAVARIRSHVTGLLVSRSPGMKVLLASMQFGRGYAQGTERYLSLLAAGLIQRGRSVMFLAGDPRHLRPAAPLGTQISDEPRVLHHPTRGWTTVMGGSRTALRTLLQRQGVSLVHLANPAHIGTGIARAAHDVGIPVVVTVMDYWWQCPRHTLYHANGHTCTKRVTWRDCLTCLATDHEHPIPRAVARAPILRAVALPMLFFGKALLAGAPPAQILRWTKRREILSHVLDTADAVIAPSQAARDWVATVVMHNRIWQVPYGLDHLACADQQSRSSPGRRRGRPEQLRIGYAGALAPHKGPHLLLEAVRQLGWAGTRVVLAGGAPSPRYRSRLEQAASDLNVEFAGSIPPDDMKAFLSTLDLLVVPSVWRENRPFVLLEALAVGCEVLGSDVPGVREALPQPEQAFEAGSASSLATHLQAWASSEPVRATAQPDTADDMVAATLAVYHAVQTSRG